MIMVGGEESYGLGGWFRTPVEDMLPVELQLPSKLLTPSVAMVLVIDRSGSMADSYNGPDAGAGGIPKIELAKDAAYLAATQLSNTDQVGVVVFDTQSQWVVPLGPLGNPSNLVSPIGRIAPGGGTNIYTGLAPAVEALKNVTAQNKHIILLTDGQDSEGTDYSKLFTDASQAGITISTVGLGEDVNTDFLSNMAKQNGGRYTFIDDPANLPKIFAKEAHLAARSYVVEEPFTPALADPSPILKDIAGTPQLKGYISTKIKPTATEALVTKRNEPLLAHWQYGLGRVAAWTSDAKARWATDWLSWPDFPKFWGQVVRWTVAENEAGGLQVQTKTVGNRIYVSADALSLDSQYLNGLDVKAKVVSSGLSSQQDVVLTQTAPGHYEGYFVPNGTGSYIVNVQGSGQSGTAVTGSAAGSATNTVNLAQTIGAVASYSPEYKQLGTNQALLKDIAALSGGKVLTTPEQAFSEDLSRTTRQQALWPWLMLLALLLFTVDIAVRRVRLSPAALWQNLKRKQARLQLAEARAAVTPSVLNQLLAAKQRVKSNPTSLVEPPQLSPVASKSSAHQKQPALVYFPPDLPEQFTADNNWLGELGPAKAKAKEKKPAAPPPSSVAPSHKPNGTTQAYPKAVSLEEPASTYSGLLRRLNRTVPAPSEALIEVEQSATVKAASGYLTKAVPASSATAQVKSKVAKPAPAPKKPSSPPPPPPAPAENDNELTSQLLRAKQRARTERHKSD
jgi:hypothetical protein